MPAAPPIAESAVDPIDAYITAEMAKGFTLYMVKAVLSGRTDEIIDLAQGNLWR